MAVKIISRATWGAQPWDHNPSSSGPATVALSQRSEFFIHYDGAAHITRTGYAIPRAIEAEHFGNGWSGIGYNFVVSQAGEIFEGRGWTRQGAHCPGHNVSGLGVQIAIGGDQEPTAKALAAARALYEEACDKTGRRLAKKGHKDGYATACPGTKLYAWVKAGMPADGYQAAPDPGGSLPGGREIARYQVVINGLAYGYGAHGDHVTDVGEHLVARGFGRHYASGPGPTWTDADTLNFSDLQVSLGFTGTAPHQDADGVPGETSLRDLLGSLPSAPKATSAPAFPGRKYFVLGAKNRFAKQLQTWLDKGGWGPAYKVGPSETMTSLDLQKVAALQKHYLTKLGPADGLTGPKTWQYAFEVAHGLRKK